MQFDLLRWWLGETVRIIYFRLLTEGWGGRGRGGVVMLLCIFIQLSGHGQTVFPRPRSDDDWTRGERLTHHQAGKLQSQHRQAGHDQLSSLNCKQLSRLSHLPYRPGSLSSPLTSNLSFLCGL